MSYKNYLGKLLNEKYLTMKEDLSNPGHTFSIYLNPTTSDIDEIEEEFKNNDKPGLESYEKRGGVRYGITHDKQIYAWDATTDYHVTMERFLGKTFAWKFTYDKGLNSLTDYNNSRGKIDKNIPEDVIDRIKILHPNVKIEYDVW